MPYKTFLITRSGSVATVTFNRPEKLNPIAKWAAFVKPEGENNNGELALIASGFANPTGVAFLGNRLFVSDINGDFHVGQRELPDGFLVTVVAQ